MGEGGQERASLPFTWLISKEVASCVGIYWWEIPRIETDIDMKEDHARGRVCRKDLRSIVILTALQFPILST